jgi:hypothetical protein
VSITGAAADNCQLAGLYCDPTNDVCRNPGQFEPCLPGGPSCNPVAGSNTDNQVCASQAPQDGSPPVCLQTCQTNADCLWAWASCQATSGGNFCFSNANPDCTDYFGTCNAAGTNDGICVLISVGTQSFASCYQATLSGGGPGTACGINATRENPSFCDTSDFCMGGICEPVCNTSGTDHLCSGSNETCVQTQIYANASVIGGCIIPCDIADLDGGGCVATDAGVSTRCYPGGLFGGFPDNGTGLCVAEPAAPLAIGQPCFGMASEYEDPCVPGAICLGTPAAGFFCTQLCTNVGQLCADGVTTCSSINGLNSTGYCQ